MAHHEPPHQDLRCLQIQLFSSLVVKELTPKFVETNTVIVKRAHCTFILKMAVDVWDCFGKEKHLFAKINMTDLYIWAL